MVDYTGNLLLIEENMTKKGIILVPNHRTLGKVKSQICIIGGSTLSRAYCTQYNEYICLVIYSAKANIIQCLSCDKEYEMWERL